MLSTEEFREFAKGVVLFAHVTTRIEGRRDEDLLSRKGGTGFPYLVAMDAEGRVTAGLEGGRTVDAFGAMVARGKEYAAKKARKDLPAEEALALLTHDLKYGNLDLAGAKAAAAALKGLTPEQKRSVDHAILDKEIRDATGAIKTGSPEERQAVGKVMAGFLKEGREPDPDGGGFQPYWILLLDHAEAAKDAALFEKALGKLREKLGSNPGAKGFFEKQEQRLEKLKAE